MAKPPHTQSSSAFDAMLAPTRKRFDELYRGGRPRAGVPAGSPNLATGRQVTARAPRAPANFDCDPDSLAARSLTERFGGDWRYEIAEQTRDGDEAIVLGRLTFGKTNAVRTQFGRARISGSPVAAASGGVRFKVGGSGTAQDEREAFRRAAEAALTNCVDLI